MRTQWGNTQGFLAISHGFKPTSGFLLRDAVLLRADEGKLKQFMYLPEGAPEKVSCFQVTADDITLCLGRVSRVEYKPKCEQAGVASEAHQDA